MHFLTTAITAASLAALANAHGYFTKPAGRPPGAVFESACGQQAYYNMEGSINGNIQGLEQVVQNQPDYKPAECHLWKCKGLKYADNTANVQKYTAGETVPLHFSIVAPHTGTANVSIISLATDNGEILAANLAKWDVYASNSVPIVASQEQFSIKMPTDLGSKCAKGGDCAIQMHWNAADINQTYQSCIDFTMPAAASKRHVRDFQFWES